MEGQARRAVLEQSGGLRQQELRQDRAVELMVGMVRCLMRTQSSATSENPPSTHSGE
jgi:hypothetical protein